MDKEISKSELELVERIIRTLMDWSGHPESYEDVDEIEVLYHDGTTITFGDLVSALKLISDIKVSQRVKIK